MAGAYIELGKSFMEAVSTKHLQAYIKDVFDNETRDKTRLAARFNLAASYGTLTRESIQEMDDGLKAMIGVTITNIKELRNPTWEGLMSCMKQNSCLQEKAESEINRSEMLIKEDISSFKFDNSPDRSTVNEVYAWFEHLIEDDDVLQDTGIDMDLMVNIVAKTGAAVKNLVTLIGKTDYQERDILDIGLLRYPDIQKPYFKLYRIRLKAWKKCNRILMLQEDKNGISGTYNCVKFETRPEVIAELSESAIKKAVKEAEDSFA